MQYAKCTVAAEISELLLQKSDDHHITLNQSATSMTLKHYDIHSRILFYRKRSNLQQPFSRLLKLKEMNPIFKALLNFCITKTFTNTKIIKSFCLFAIV